MNVVQRSWSDAVYDDTVLGFCHIGNLQNLPADTTENIRPSLSQAVFTSSGTRLIESTICPVLSVGRDVKVCESGELLAENV